MTNYCDQYLAKIAAGKQGPARAKEAQAEIARRAAEKARA